MAELLIKIGDRSARPDDYKDGDVLCAFNRRRIRCCHAQHVCHVKVAPRNSSGLIVAEAVTRDWYEHTHQYRFERVSQNEVKRTNLLTLEEELFSDTPNEKGEAMDVGLFIRRRKMKPTHYLFGSDGAEVWYGGRQDHSHAAMDRVWTAIETKTPLREADAAFQRWPLGTQDVRSHLPIAVDDFDDATAEDLVAPEVDDTDPENPVVVKRRQHNVAWRTSLGLTARERDQVLDSTQPFDHRGAQEFARSIVVTKKPPTPRGPQ